MQQGRTLLSWSAVAICSRRATANDSVRRITADNIGMLATMMNALALADVFQRGWSADQGD